MTDSKASRPAKKDRAVAQALRFYRSRKRKVLLKTRLSYERAKQFLMLPGCYRRIRAFEDCRKSPIALALDLLTWFFSYKTLPTHYGICRLWEVDRKEWKYYYGSNYLPHQQARLKRTVQPFEYRVLFNDKHLCVLLCKSLGIRTPRTHGTLSPADDYRAQISAWLSASPVQKLIIKPLAAFGGRGIVLAERTDDGIVVRSGRASVPLEQFVLEGKAIVQDVLTQDARMAAFSPSSVNTLRVVTMLTPQDDMIIVNASFRTGVGNAFVDNWSAGGVSVGVDCHNGRLKKYAYDRKSQRFAAHPTSGIVFEDRPVPEWDRVCITAAAVQSAFSFYRLLGLDMALDEGGQPVILEINHGPDLAGLEQKAGPLLRNEQVLRAFGEYDLLVNRHQRKLYAALLESDRASGRTKRPAEISS